MSSNCKNRGYPLKKRKKIISNYFQNLIFVIIFRYEAVIEDVMDETKLKVRYPADNTIEEIEFGSDRLFYFAIDRYFFLILLCVYICFFLKKNIHKMCGENQFFVNKFSLLMQFFLPLLGDRFFWKPDIKISFLK